MRLSIQKKIVVLTAVVAGCGAPPPVQDRPVVPAATAATAPTTAPSPTPEQVAAEKERFRQRLFNLKADGEFYTDESVATMAGDMRVLFEFTDDDVPREQLYNFLILSSGLSHMKGPQGYAVKHFDDIANSDLKLFWATALVETDSATPEAIGYVRQSLQNSTRRAFPKEGMGSNFDSWENNFLARHPLVPG